MSDGECQQVTALKKTLISRGGVNLKIVRKMLLCCVWAGGDHPWRWTEACGLRWGRGLHSGSGQDDAGEPAGMNSSEQFAHRVLWCVKGFAHSLKATVLLFIPTFEMFWMWSGMESTVLLFMQKYIKSSGFYCVFSAKFCLYFSLLSCSGRIFTKRGNFVLKRL